MTQALDIFPDYELKRADNVDATNHVPAPAAGMKIVVLEAQFARDVAENTVVRETGASPDSFTRIRSGVGTLGSHWPWNPYGWLETRDGRGLDTSFSCSAVVDYKEVPA